MRRFVITIVLSGLAIAASAAEPTVIVVVDADRGALIRWPLPAGALPKAGFQVERVQGAKREVVGVARPGTAAEADQQLSQGKAQLVKAYYDMSARSGSNDPKQKKDFVQARLSIELLTLQDPKLARFLGLSIEDRRAAFGAVVSYVVTALGPSPTVYATSPLTKIEAMPPPFPPGDLHGTAIRKGVALFWSVPSKAEHNPAGAITYEIKKKSAVLTPEPILKLNSSQDAAGFIDEKPEIEATSTYTIAALDIFGRRGAESTPVQVFFPDFTALDPPATIESRSAEGKAILVWIAKPNKYRKGWNIVRALQPAAAGEPITAQPVTTATFTDPTGRAGTTYYYRVSAVNIRGEEGLPMVSQAVLVRSGKAPASPSNLSAELKTGKVILSWDAPPETVAAFQVERSMGGAEWNLLTKVATSEPRYVDVYPRDTTGTLQYRVVAWSFDDTPSAPSQALTVPLPDTQPPLPPIINGIDGGRGQVAMNFTPNGQDATGVYVLRSPTAKDTGVILNRDPLSPNAKTFTDTDVEAGTMYFYRLVAVDAAGNRSVPSEPTAVRVSDPPLPQPSAPTARFESKPFPRVIVEFTPPASTSVRYALERRDAKGKWLLIQGPFPHDATSAMDTIPLKGAKSAYRLISISSSGAPGPRSAEVEVNVPK